VLSDRIAVVRVMALLTLAGAVVAPLARAAKLSAMQVVGKALETQEGVKDYVATVKVTVAAPNVQVPERTVTVYYKRPGKLHVESQGLAIIPRDALLLGNLRKHVQEDTTATLVGSGVLKGRPVHCIKLTPKESWGADERFLCWIDSERYVLAKSELWKGSSKALTITLTHAKADKGFLMPQRIVCDIPAWVLGDSSEPARVTIVYSNYRINTGLPDSIFAEDQD
jgi:outer membrane lipoprotein-sorting protein